MMANSSKYTEAVKQQLARRGEAGQENHHQGQVDGDLPT